MSATVARLNRRALIRLSGPDARAFLQGQITQDVLTLPEGGLRYGAILTPQGKLVCDLFVAEAGGDLLLDLPADLRESLLRRLTMFRLRAKVDLAADETPVFAVWNGEAPGARPDPRLPVLGSRLYGEAAATADEDAYDAFRLGTGATDPQVDAPPETTYPIEANLDLLNAIDFHKGCFVGQETTSRMKRRGTIKSRMLPIVFDGPPPPYGTEIVTGEDLRAGEVRGGRPGRALALVRLDRIEGQTLTAGETTVSVDRPAWLEI